MGDKSFSTEMYQKVVQETLFKEEEVSAVKGHKTFIVHMTASTLENEEPQEHQLSFQASSAGEAKSMAMIQAGERDYKNAKITGVDMVPNSGEELDNYGSGQPLGLDSDNEKGQVMPSDVSKDLPNGDA